MSEETEPYPALSAEIEPTSSTTFGFATYAEYLRLLGPSWSSLWHWALIRYLEDEDHLAPAQLPLSGSILRISSAECSVSECSTLGSPPALRNFLSTTKDDCQYQIVIMYYSSLASWDSPSQKSLPIHPSVIDAVGLELNVSPMCWYSLLLESSYLPNFVHPPNAWHERNQMLQVGRDFLFLPRSRGTSRTKTGLYFLGHRPLYET